MNLTDKRLWYGVAAVIVVLLVIAYAALVDAFAFEADIG